MKCTSYSAFALAVTAIFFISPRVPKYNRIAPDVSGASCHSSHEKFKNRPFLVYVGSSSIEQPGFVSYSFEEFDLTKESDFERLFLPETVDIFFSEHTFEHIEIAEYEKIFLRFFKYLRIGGKVRLAIPTYPPNHETTTLDREYGHVSFPTSDNLVNLLRSAGFQVQKIEWIDFDNHQRCSNWVDQCEGRVRRSMRLDSRNAQYWNKEYSNMLKNEFNQISDFCIPTNVSLVQSTIIQGVK